jgi:hypothetical protein
VDCGLYGGVHASGSIGSNTSCVGLGPTGTAITTSKEKRRLSFSLEWHGTKRPLSGLGAALLVSLSWWLAMPAHVVNNHHVTVRHFFVFYLYLILAIVRSLSVDRGVAPSQTMTRSELNQPRAYYLVIKRCCVLSCSYWDT